MSVSKKWASFSLDQHGRVVLSDQELDQLVDSPASVIAGGANQGCSGANAGCTNSNCEGSWNGSCSNTGCEGTTNGVRCENKVRR